MRSWCHFCAQCQQWFVCYRIMIVTYACMLLCKLSQTNWSTVLLAFYHTEQIVRCCCKWLVMLILCVLQCHIPDCGKTFSTVYNLKNHIKLHERACSEACQVSGCEAKFSTRQLLDNHMKEQHPDDKRYRQTSLTLYHQ